MGNIKSCLADQNCSQNAGNSISETQNFPGERDPLEHSGFALDFAFGLCTRLCIRAFHSILHSGFQLDFAYEPCIRLCIFGLCTRLYIRTLHSTLHSSFALDFAFELCTRLCIRVLQFDFAYLGFAHDFGSGQAPLSSNFPETFLLPVRPWRFVCMTWTCSQLR